MNISLPKTDKVLTDRMKLVRRDIGNLLFHFTRSPDIDMSAQGSKNRNALSILRKILEEGKLLGSSRWIANEKKCICFTEAPIHEFAALFSLIKIAADKKQRPRYEPYGIAVRKEWLYEKGARPVIYDSEDLCSSFSEALQYRFVPFNPQKGIDYTWEREWRICCDELLLDPEHTLVVVPDAKTAFDIAYSYSEENISTENISTQSQTITKKDTVAEEERKDTVAEGGQVKILTRKPKWMTVSLDLFDIEPE